MFQCSVLSLSPFCKSKEDGVLTHFKFQFEQYVNTVFEHCTINSASGSVPSALAS